MANGDSPEETLDIGAVVERLDEIKAGLAGLSQPPTQSEQAQTEKHEDGGIVTGVARARAVDIERVRASALQLPPAQLKAAIRDQLEFGSQEGAGIPFAAWANESTNQKILADPVFAKFIDTVSGNVLIRQDLEPLIHAAFVRRFPAFARVDKIPANGLVHTYQRVDQRPAASYIAETAAVPDSQGVYTRATSNIAVIALRVGTSLKQTLSVAAGGMPWNTEQQEISFGIESIAAQLQQTYLQGNATVVGGTLNTVDGLYDANSFDGLRRTVPAANIRALGADTILEGMNQADALAVNNGGLTSVVILRVTDAVQFENELQPFRRFVDSEKVEVVPGLPNVTGVNLSGSGLVPVIKVPGADATVYTVGGDAGISDAFLIDESVVAMPYLGSDTPTVIELPLGVTGALTKLYILVGMFGVATRVPNFISKLRIT